MDRLGVGFIGTGFIARFHAQAWKGIRGSDIVAVYNPRAEGAKDLAAYISTLGLDKPKVYSDLYEMLSDSSVDAIWILNPNYARLEAVKAISEEVRQGRNNFHGVCCEKPLARTSDEAEEMMKIIEDADLLHGYLENQVFAPSVISGRNGVWKHGAPSHGRPYLTRAAEEHSGPHKPWFWDPTLSGGGVLLDMACHSIEVGRFLLSDPNKPKGTLNPVAVQCITESLKWTREPYLSKLRDEYGADYSKHPAEDYASVFVWYEDEEDNFVISEARTSWNYVGPGLRLSLEVLGPEYSISLNSLRQELNVFFSRQVGISASEEFLEKQTAEQGLMPVIPEETVAYGYLNQDRHMVEAFVKGEMPLENWSDGLLIAQLMMTAYKSADEKRVLTFSKQGVKGYTPLVAQGKWKP
jgi:predicted dehydrogenase